MRRRAPLVLAALAFALLAPTSSFADCAPPVAGVVNCTGDELNGVPNPPGGTHTLNVLDLTTNIAPANGVPGIVFSTAGANNEDPAEAGPPVTINFDGSGSITVNAANGIIGQSTAGTGEAGGGIGEDGVNGGTGGTVFVNNDGVVTSTGAAAVVAISAGGGGGNGGNAALVNAGDAGSGGAGGSAAIDNTGTIQTFGDNSAGLLAVSRGGQGGIGGNSSASGDAGTGGGGGAAGAVTVDNDANITTGGSGSAGILARSLGGNGGNGGNGFLIVIGGGGGGGATGNGSTVNITHNGVIMTNGAANSVGILAQSVGGFAGGAGDVAGLFTFGGDGNSGGVGGRVDVDAQSGSITTAGERSYGILAQSIGGGGGAGGTGAGLVGFGGDGGPGGAGGEVEVTNNTEITTTANGATGIVAQSVGGGGGAGGTGAGLAAIGGGGGGGGAASGVTVTNTNTIDVSGNGAGFEFGNYGIFAQSIGGGGGSANASGGIVAIGGTGGPGGNSGTVVVNNDDAITSHCTGCRDAGAIYAQSVGGGGGRGGNTGGLFSIGGTGGGGGTSGAVTVTNSGALETHGTFSRGIFAQSIGGGGGDGGFAGGVFAGGGGGGEGGSAANPLRIGGKGSTVRANQFGAGVTVNNTGGIATTGDDSQAIFAQSVGGGGGNGGGAVAVGAFIAIAVGGSGGVGGDGGLVTVNNVADDPANGPILTTTGERSSAVFAQSVGGGGGSGGFAVAAQGGIFGGFSAAFGGNGASGGAGGDVNVGSNGSISTRGSFSSGIYAESIGGGGGRGGISVAAGATVNGVAATLSFGGGGGPGGSAGDVTVDNASNVTTGCDTCISDESHGIFASSIGGGGGSGGASISAAGGQYGAVSLSFGGNAGTGNNSGVVDVGNSGGITTWGRQSHGILAQSIGGGGGSGGFSGALSFALTGAGSAALGFGGDGGDGGAGNTVIVDNRGDITTHGEGSAGILAQSVGGGGGNGGFAGAISFSVSGANSFANSLGGTAGGGSLGRNVTVTHDGAIRTHGNNATGILAQSVGGGGGTGGFSLALGGSIDGGASAQSVGGPGGNGGASGIVRVGLADNRIGGSIETSGAQSHGIQAQTVAGGGGNGGFSLGAAFSISGSGSANSVGGGGGSGQHASQFIDVGGEMVEIASVEVFSNARIVTGADCLASGVGCQASGSHGILAQSIGGGGGSGGFSVAGTFSLDGDADASSVGGNGAGGGDGGIVVVESGGEITTRGPSSHGIFAQSVGGGGGSGAFSIAGAVSIEGDGKAQSVGGSGGAAGDGHDVTVTVLNNITTAGVLSHGVLAQSVGGGGGDGGFSLAAGFSLSSDSSANSVGGAGSGGGSAGLVTVNVGSVDTPLLFPTIHTTGAGSIGVFAQSVGGGGGSGGFSGGLSLAIDGAAENEVGGGSGGAGGVGGEVYVSNWGTIRTEGDNAAGILAQSVGGGGGNGGFSVAASLGDGAAVANSIGGAAGEGSESSKVQVDNFGLIETRGSFSHGIIAQSIGGSGGNGGFAIAVGVSMGGSDGSSKVGGGAGGGGGNGGEVVVNNTGSIVVEGDNAFGVFAQSVGGGGGSGGIAGGLAIGGSIESAVGGDGGKGGSGGDVTVTSTGSITTTKGNSSAVFAQSVAGSGGWSGLAIGLGTEGSESDGLTLSLGSKSIDKCLSINFDECLPADGARGTVTVTIDGGTTVTHGSLSYGLLAQAIAGGGGAMGTVLEGALSFVASDVVVEVGSNGAISSNAMAQNTTYANAVTTNGLGAIGLISQSIGGGGGVNAATAEQLDLNPTGEDEFIVRIGGYAQDPTFIGTGSGGGFSLTAESTVATTKDNAMGMVGQTIGGGGGIGTISVGTASNFGDVLDITVGGSQLTDGSFVGNAGPASTLTANDQVTTSGALSHGIVAQSIGGGGGIANVVFQNGVTLTNGVDVTIGSGTGGAGGAGGDLTVTAHGVETSGAGAMGIVVQSIGGGGGLAGVYSGGFVLGQDGFSLAPVTIAAGGSTNGGDSGTATLHNYGDVRTTGFGAHGIVVQSIAGGGGIVGSGSFASAIGGSNFAGSIGGAGDAGDIVIDNVANIVTTGMDTTALFAQSATGASGTRGNITVDILGGLISGGLGDGHAVWFMGGLDNTLTNAGKMTTSKDILGMTVLAGIGNDVVTNTGWTVGSVDLAQGSNAFTNKQTHFFTDVVPTYEARTRDGLFDAGAIAFMGAGNLLTNEGLFAPGAFFNRFTTDVDGKVVQTEDGFYGVDLNYLLTKNGDPQPSDLTNVTETAELNGNAYVNIVRPGLAKTGSHETLIMTADDGITDSGVALKYAATVVATYSLVYEPIPDPNNLLLSYIIDWSPAGLTQNQHSVGDAINKIQTDLTSPDFEPIAAALYYQPTIEALGKAYDSLSGEGTTGVQQASFSAQDDFTTAIGNQVDLRWSGHQSSLSMSYSSNPAPLAYAREPGSNDPTADAFANPYLPDWTVWASGWARDAGLEGTDPPGTASLRYKNYGMALGIDHRPTPDAIYGMALAGGPASFRVDDRATSGKLEDVNLAFYKSKQMDDVYLSGVMMASWFNNKTDRFIHIPGTEQLPFEDQPLKGVEGLSEEVVGAFQSRSLSSRIEVGTRKRLGPLVVSPFAALQLAWLNLDPYKETKPDGSPSQTGLSYFGRDIWSVPLFLGTQIERHATIGEDMVATAWLRAAWVHEFQPRRTHQAEFLAAPGYDFVIDGALAAADAVRLNAGFGIDLDRKTNIYLNFNGEFSSNAASYAGSGGFKRLW